jgi:chemotaxis protein methyltransferase WspC
MFYAEIECMLQQAMGLDSASIGSSAVRRAVKERLSVCEIDDVYTYWDLLRTCDSELQALIEAVIVPETWFFRDRESFNELARMANEPGRAGHPVWRLLSLPCSSGEEPYSMAMTLLDAGLSAEAFRIDAVDISAQGLARAQRAEYGKNSFRGADLTFRDRYFEEAALGWRLSDSVRDSVLFQQGNLLAGDLLPGAQVYDVVFCRNLLIYFDRPTQERSVQVLKRLLKPTGVLFVGPSESGLLLRHRFESRHGSAGFRLRSSGSRSKALMRVPPLAGIRSEGLQPKIPQLSDEPKPVPAPVARQSPETPLKSAAVPLTWGELELDEAEKLADQGLMAEAEKSCEAYVREHGPSARSLFLMGLIRAAAGDLAEAHGYYRKALYFDRNHHGALVHLRLLLEKQGDVSGARVIHHRVQRLLRHGSVG